jgi:hypothetical protein
LEVLGVVFWGFPEHPFQVIPDYRGAARLAQQEGKQEEATLAVRAAQKRARSWLAKGKSGSWRPKKRYRCASHEWMVSLDNQLRQGTGMSGLEAFQVQTHSSKGDPRSHVSSAGLAFRFALKHYYQLFAFKIVAPRWMQTLACEGHR